MKIVPVEDIPKSEDVPLENLKNVYKTCLEMEGICLDGVGLAAVQVGIPWKLFIVKSTSDFEYYLNCEYQPLVDQKDIQSIEGCLSLRGESGAFRQFLVERFSKIRVKGKKLNDFCKLSLEDVDATFDGQLAVIFQHEIDHQNFILISDIGKEMEITNVK